MTAKKNTRLATATPIYVCSRCRKYIAATVLARVTTGWSCGMTAGCEGLPSNATGRHFQVVNTWNGGAGGRRVQFVSPEVGTEGFNQCFKWVHDNTSFSFDEATTNQGYHVEAVLP